MVLSNYVYVKLRVPYMGDLEKGLVFPDFWTLISLKRLEIGPQKGGGVNLGFRTMVYPLSAIWIPNSDTFFRDPPQRYMWDPRSIFPLFVLIVIS